MATAPGPASIPEAIEWLTKRFRPEATAGVAVTVLMELSGEPSGDFWVRVESGHLEAGEGRVVDADVVFELTSRDFFDVLAGTANPDLLFTAERLRVKGDLSLALKLRSLFGNAA